MAISPFSVVASHVWIGGTFRPARVGVRDGVIDEVVPLASRYLPVGPPGDVGGEVYRLPEDTILLQGSSIPTSASASPGTRRARVSAPRRSPPRQEASRPSST